MVNMKLLSWPRHIYGRNNPRYCIRILLPSKTLAVESPRAINIDVVNTNYKHEEINAYIKLKMSSALNINAKLAAIWKVHAINQ